MRLMLVGRRLTLDADAGIGFGLRIACAERKKEKRVCAALPVLRIAIAIGHCVAVIGVAWCATCTACTLRVTRPGIVKKVDHNGLRVRPYGG
jgi:hypothetical protein